VIDTRVVEDGRSIRRRRECERCGSRFTTFEKLEVVNFMVSKSDGNKEVYNREKVEKSILKSLNKRNISAEGVDNILLRLESKWSKNKS
jgi:transcriptional repressor NrdR